MLEFASVSGHAIHSFTTEALTVVFKGALHAGSSMVISLIGGSDKLLSAALTGFGAAALAYGTNNFLTTISHKVVNSSATLIVGGLSGGVISVLTGGDLSRVLYTVW